MILYIYDHCPYCVKARMIFGFKNQKVKIKTLLNDDEKTPTDMIGVKMVPILEYEAGKFMPESMDIVDFIDKKHPPQKVEPSEDSKLLNWISQNNGLNYKLAMPRWVQSPLEEFQTASARDYFEKKENRLYWLFFRLPKRESLFNLSNGGRVRKIRRAFKARTQFLPRKTKLERLSSLPLSKVFEHCKRCILPS